jgi:DNA-directed RNA polymerase specialized sigma subunit
MSSRSDKDLELWKVWKEQPTPENLQPLLDRFQGTINARVNEFKRAPVPQSALKAFATGQVVNSFHAFNPEGGANLNSFATTYLKKVRAFVGRHQNIGKIPEHRIGNVSDFKQAKDELTEKMGHPPDTLTLAENLGWSTAEVSRMQSELRSTHIASRELEPDLLPDLQSSHERDVLRYIHYELAPDERLVFEYSLGLYGKPRLSAADIAKTMNISPPKVSRLRKKIDKKLRARGV